MYLKVQYNNSIKQYTLTNNYNKPYIKVSNSILPLTTNTTTNGIHINIQANNTTYRPLEYNSMSTSATYYTSGINSNGLSSITALTRSSTYDTQYYTRSSTSSTVYDTRSSTSGTSYLTQYGTDMTCQQTVFRNRTTASVWSSYTIVDKFTSYGNKTFKSSYSISYAEAYNGTTPFTFGIKTTSNNWGYMQTFTFTYPYFNNYFTYGYYSWTSSTEEHNKLPYTNTATGIARFDYNTNAFVTSSDYFSSLTPFVDAMNTSYTSVSKTTLSVTANWYTVIIDNYTSFTRGFVKITTGTSYLTRSSTSNTRYLTRSSTYSTIYLTRSSTSGYSGVSSSSSQSSGWL